MEKLLKPNLLDIDPESPNAAKQWTHWLKQFENFIEVSKVEENILIKVLQNCVSYCAYEFISDCTTYENAIQILNEVYMKPKSEIFARHLLATRKQLVTESIDQYVQSLKLLSKDCNFRDVTSEENKNEYIRDSFINGLLSPIIRQRLLENKSLELQEAINKARTIEMAQEHSKAYTSNTHNEQMLNPVNAVNKDKDVPTNSNPNKVTSYPLLDGIGNGTVAATSEQKCFFCGNNRHPRNACPAREATCKFCGKLGHFYKVCKSKKRSTISAASDSHNNLSVSAAAPGNLSKAVVIALINNNINSNTLIDTGSSDSYINHEFVLNNRLKILPGGGHVSMASSELLSKVQGYVVVNIEMLGHRYNSVKLSILPKLCCDVLIGHDIMKQHSRVDVNFGGTKPPLSVCSLVPACVESPRLFGNLTPGCKPIATKSRRFSEPDTTFIESEVNDMLSKGIIEESSSPWRAQVLITHNENHKKRLVVDYSQTINKFTLLDAYPLPNIDDIVSKVSKYSIFSTIDLQSAYHQIPIRKEEKEFTAFEAAGKLYQFTRIPFGVTNGVACFQRVLDSIITNEGLTGTYAYIDDITICGNSQLEHDSNLKQFLEAVNKYNLTINDRKCKFSQSSISLLGYLISNNSIKPDPDRLKPLMDLPPPKNASEMKRATGMFAHYSKWVPRFSEKIQKLVSCKTFPLPQTALSAFDELKQDISKSIITTINYELPLVIETDASDYALAATLSQEGRPIAFFSRSLSDCEKRHSSIEKEACAIVESIRKWRHFLIGHHFKLITDQQALSFIFNLNHSSKIKNDKIMRWRLELSCYSFDIVYRPGRDNIVADTLSRICGASDTRHLFSLHQALCHPGITRMFHWVRSKNLPYSLDDVKKMTSACPTCAEIKPRFFKPQNQHLIKATMPFERLNIDFKGPIPSSCKNHYILTVIDEYSRFPFAFPCRDVSSATVTRCLNQLFSVFGTPSYIHSDRGTSFMSQELTSFLHLRGIATSRTTPYNPEGNGQAERYNGTIWRSIMLALKSRNLNVNQWEVVLDDALHSIRSLLCTTTNVTPHERFFIHPRRSSNGTALPSWLTYPGPVLIKRPVRSSKYEPLVEEAHLIEANPEYAFVRKQNGQETTVSLKHLAPRGNTNAHLEENIFIQQDNDKLINNEETKDNQDANSDNCESEVNHPYDFIPRRSTRNRKSPQYLKDYEV